MKKLPLGLALVPARSLCLALAIWLTTFITALGAAPKQKVLLDCDLAGDVDDAFALALVLASPELELLGVVLDHGNTTGRAKVACRMLYETGLDHIPVIVGRPTPSVVGQDKEIAGESNQFVWGHGFNRTKPNDKAATDFIIETLRAYPNEVVLLTVGPVCNIQDVAEP